MSFPIENPLLPVNLPKPATSKLTFGVLVPIPKFPAAVIIALRTVAV